MQRVPELAGRELTLRAAQRRDHEPQLPRRPAPGTARALRHPPRRQRHAPARHQPRGRARGDRRGGRASASGPEVTAFIRPEGYLVTRFIEGSRGLATRPVHRPETLVRVGRVAAPDPRRPGDPGPVRPVPDRRGVPRAGRSPAASRSRPSTSSPRRSRRRIELAFLTEPGRAAAVPQRPAERELHRRRDADPDRRLGVRGHGRPVLRPRQLLDQPRARRPTRTRRCSRPTTASVRPDRLARLTLMRIVSDFREAMWGVLQQGISTLDVDFVAYAGEHFERLLAGRDDAGLRAGPPRGGRRLNRGTVRWLPPMADEGLPGRERPTRPTPPAGPIPLVASDRAALDGAVARPGGDRLLRDADRPGRAGARVPWRRVRHARVASGPPPSAASRPAAPTSPPAPDRARRPSPAPSAAAALPVAAAPTPSPSGDPVLVGAGDIADCGLDGDDADRRC